MYEDKKAPLIGRIIWLAVAILAIIAVVWFVLWLFIFRSSGSDTTSKDNGSTQSVSESTSGSAVPSQSDTSESATSNTSKSSFTSGSTSSTSTTEPTTTGTLANTGPESFWAPALIAVAGGTVYYQARLRRRKDQQ